MAERADAVVHPQVGGVMFGRLAEKLADTGWANCIPLILGTKRALVPWRVHRVFCVTDAQRVEWAERFPAAGVGYIIEPDLVAVEVDSLNPSEVERVSAVTRRELGDTPLLRIGRPPKRMWFFRTADAIPKIAAHPLEVLPASYHVVLYGVHEFTKQPYTWHGGEPLDTPPERLPCVTRAQVDRWLAAAAEVVAPTGRALHTVNGDLFAALRAERAGRIGMAWLAVVERQLRDAMPGALHDVLLSVTAALVGVGYDDAAIRAMIEQHFGAPRSGPYSAVWKQVDDAIAGARRRWTSLSEKPRGRLQAVTA